MKDINFFEGIKKSTQKKAASAVKICTIALIVTIMLIGGIYSYIIFSGKKTSGDIDNITTQIKQLKLENPGLDQINYKKKKLEALKSYEKQTQQFLTNINAYPVLDSKLILNIEKRKPKGVKIISMEYKSGVLRLTCMADNFFLPAEFAENLKVYEMIEKINYNGNFIASEETKDLQFVIDCQLKGGHI